MKAKSKTSAKKNKPGIKNSLVDNIHARRKGGTSRSKKSLRCQKKHIKKCKTIGNRKMSFGLMPG